MKQKSPHPAWALKFRTPGTELKRINGNYYLYGVKSVYDKEIKRARKISLGIIGRITEKEGLIPSEKRMLREKSKQSFHEKEVFAMEYGYSKWLIDTLEQREILDGLKQHFPDLWHFIILMVYCRTGYQSVLKNIPFYQQQSSISDLMGWKEKMTDQKISDLLFRLGSKEKSIHRFMVPQQKKKRTVLMDATDITFQSNKVSLSQKGYNSDMSFQPQFVLLYLYDANSLRPLYYRLLPGNIREISAMKNAVRLSGLEQCVYIADKGFFSESNISELEKLGMEYIIPLKRNNKLIPYESLDEIETTDHYFEYSKRYIFHAPTATKGDRSVELFLDGKLRENEKTDYLNRIRTVPESYSKEGFNTKLNAMGTLAVIHNTGLSPQGAYLEYKTRGQVEQFFDHFKNTIDASVSHMQREESLNGWMFINHVSMMIIYDLFEILKKTPLNKKQTLNHKYSINDVVMHLCSIKRIKYGEDKYVVTELNKLTKTLVKKMNVHIT